MMIDVGSSDDDDDDDTDCDGSSNLSECLNNNIDGCGHDDHNFATLLYYKFAIQYFQIFFPCICICNLKNYLNSISL